MDGEGVVFPGCVLSVMSRQVNARMLGDPCLGMMAVEWSVLFYFSDIMFWCVFGKACATSRSQTDRHACDRSHECPTMPVRNGRTSFKLQPEP